MKAEISVATTIERTPRVMQVEGIFDVPKAAASELSWSVNIPFEERIWNVGAIIGPSGCGKSTIARELFPQQLAHVMEWEPHKSILDSFDKVLGIKDIVGILSSVGLSSPPTWLRPFHVLSNGEQFRVTMARLISEATTDIAVADEFTSVVDRTVAQIGSCAIAKMVRRDNKQFVAVTCHHDIVEWLQPDWVYYPERAQFEWRCLRRRPEIQLTINRVPSSLWERFKRHHYMTADINRSAACFAAFLGDEPIAFDAWLPFVGKLKDSRKARRGHRTVVLPDYQGIGIGRHLFDEIAAMWHGLGYRAFSGTGHPAEIASRMRYGKWRMTRAPSFSAKDTAKMRATMGKTRSADRLRASFEYIGQPMDAQRAKVMVESWALRQS